MPPPRPAQPQDTIQGHEACDTIIGLTVHQELRIFMSVHGVHEVIQIAAGRSLPLDGNPDVLHPERLDNRWLVC